MTRTKKCQIHSIWFPWTENGHSSDHPQSPLWANEKLLQVIASIVFPQRCQTVQDGTISQHLKEDKLWSIINESALFQIDQYNVFILNFVYDGYTGWTRETVYSKLYFCRKKGSTTFAIE